MTWAAARQRLESVRVQQGQTLGAAVRRLDEAGTGALLVVAADGTLRGLLTDGDVRRAVLRGVAFGTPVELVATASPMVAPEAISLRDALRAMDQGLAFQVNQLPLVQPDGQVAGLLLRRDIVTNDELALSAIIMAGGFGTRMLPLTEQVPKPMLPVQDRPVLEWTLARLRRAGITEVAISTHHLADRISSHFGDGAAQGVSLRYVHESVPLGTAGALRLLEPGTQPLLIVNGDILTGVPFAEMLAFHRERRARLTVGMRRCELQLPYGVLELDGALLCSVREKPRQQYWVNAGVYIADPSVRELIPADTRYDMTDLMQRMLDDGLTVAGFPIVEYWMDIGQPTDYIQAHADAAILEAVP